MRCQEFVHGVSRMAQRYSHLDLAERRQIAELTEAKVPAAEIARRLGRHCSTIHREISRNFCHVNFHDRWGQEYSGYYAVAGHQMAARSALTSKISDVSLPALSILANARITRAFARCHCGAAAPYRGRISGWPDRQGFRHGIAPARTSRRGPCRGVQEARPSAPAAARAMRGIYWI